MYVNYGKVKATCSKVQGYPRMNIVSYDEGNVKFDRVDYISNMIDEYTKNITGT